MPLIRIESLDDPRVWPYRNLKDRELAREGGRFIAEGKHLIRRLLASDFVTESVLLDERRVEEVAPLVPEDVSLFVAPPQVMRGIIGYDFQSGMAAIGLRKPARTLDQVLCRDRGPITLMILSEISKVENLGGLIRLSAAFGVDCLLLGERCHDPFWRQSVRVSMGTIFKLPIVHSDDLLRDLRRLHDEWGVELIATVLDADAEPLAGTRRAARFGLLFGNESQGLDAREVAACDRRVTIPMGLGTDSLNVTTSAGIFLFHYTQGAGQCESTRGFGQEVKR